LSTTWRTLRRRLLTPNVSATKLATRGFHEKSPAARELLEAVGEQFLTGYGHAVEFASIAESEQHIEAIPKQFRGFAYEGAGMGYAVLDAMPLPGGGRVGRFLASPGGDAHIYTAYVGIGWAMARLPTFLWSRLDAPDPLLRWLVLDGYGFHQAYFRTEKYVHQQFQEKNFRWPADDTTGYASQVIDQGIGRALWFVGGTDADEVGTLIERFPAARHGDLYAGAGLAATYACGVEEGELRRFRERAGVHRFQLAQGSAFAAEARLRGGILLPETAVATRALCGTTPERAAQICAATRPGPQRGDRPVWEIWRRRIADVFASTKVSQG
jgi:enediyne biosynthesis protein E3